MTSCSKTSNTTGDVGGVCSTHQRNHNLACSAATVVAASRYSAAWKAHSPVLPSATSASVDQLCTRLRRGAPLSALRADGACKREVRAGERLGG